MTEYPTFDPDRPFNDPITSCCGRDAADCDCGPADDGETYDFINHGPSDGLGERPYDYDED